MNDSAGLQVLDKAVAEMHIPSDNDKIHSFFLQRKYLGLEFKTAFSISSSFLFFVSSFQVD